MEYQHTLTKMLSLSGAQEVYQVTIVQMLAIFRLQYPAIDAVLWDEAKKEFEQTSLDELVILLVPVYQKHFSQSELEELIQFYQSPIGAKLAGSTALMSQETVEVGEKWGEKVAQRFINRMELKGY